MPNPPQYPARPDLVVVAGLYGDPHLHYRHVPPRLLAGLHSFARRCLAEGRAANAMIAAGITSPDFVDLYRVGYLPAEHRQALTPEDLLALDGLDLSGCLILPACSSGDTPTALCAWRLEGAKSTFVGTISIADQPHALLGARIARVAGDLILVDQLDELVRRFVAGERHVLLLRPDLSCDVQVGLIVSANADHRVTIAVEERVEDLLAACDARGLALVPAPTVEPWRFVEFDGRYHRAVFACGMITAVIDTPWHGTTESEVEVRVPGQRAYHGRIAITSERQMAEHVSLVSAKTGCPPELLLALLNVDLHGRLGEIERTGGASEAAVPQRVRVPVIARTGVDDQVGADPIEAFATDMDMLGWIGDRRAKTLALLALVGSTLDRPPWLVLRGEPAATLPAMDLLRRITPAARALPLARETERTLPHLAIGDLRHRCLLVEDAGSLRTTTHEHLRMLAVRGALAIPRAVRDPATGRTRSQMVEISGPAGLIAASQSSSPLDDLALAIHLDDSSAHLSEIEARDCIAAEGLGCAGAMREALLRKWSTWLASLPGHQVLVPGAKRIIFPATSSRHLVDLRLLLGFAAASALIHHCDRTVVADHLLGVDADIALAIDATRGLIGLRRSALSRTARLVIADLTVAQDRTLSLPELIHAHPQISPAVLRHAVGELTHAALVESIGSGRGRRAHPIRLIDPVALAPHDVGLTRSETLLANISPVLTGTYG